MISRPIYLIELLHQISGSEDDVCWAYFLQLIYYLSDFSADINREPIFSQKFKYVHTFPQSGVVISPKKVRNSTWTFASVMTKVGVTRSGKHAFEFVIGTSGIIQVGWANSKADFNELGGWGTGDDPNSYGYDGVRKRKWHGNYTENYTYGLNWSANDILTCMLDLDNKTVSFALNGMDLGVAFKDVDSSQMWYPAASFTENQHGEFRFGGVLDPMFYIPDGYSKINVRDQELLLLKTSDSDPKMPLNMKIPKELKDLDLTFISFYYEIAIVLPRDTKQTQYQLGLQCKDGNVVILVVDYVGRLGQIMTGNSKLNVPEQISLEVSHNSQTQSDFSVIETVHLSPVVDGDIFGVGIHQNEDFIFFTHNGRLIGCPLPTQERFAFPYIKDLSDYKINFGSEDFKTLESNTVFSPTKALVISG